MKISEIARMLALGDTALSVEFGKEVDKAVNARVLAAERAVAAAQIPGIIETVPSFRALGVFFDPDRTNSRTLCAALGRLEIAENTDGARGRAFTVPVLYDGPDLDAVARAAGVSADEAARLHAAGAYHVYMLGFLPGFAYLGDLPEPLRLPRLKEPRLRVAPGSVAIAEQMTAIYPAQSPGGWHLIGRTPLALFDPANEPPNLFAPGDVVTFCAIDAAEFARLSQVRT